MNVATGITLQSRANKVILSSKYLIWPVYPDTLEMTYTYPFGVTYDIDVFEDEESQIDVSFIWIQHFMNMRRQCLIPIVELAFIPDEFVWIRGRTHFFRF